MITYFCTSTESKHKLFVAAERWFEAWDWARRMFQVDNPQCVPCEQPAEVEIRFVGSDYGWKPDRHMEIREAKVGGWGEWHRA